MKEVRGNKWEPVECSFQSKCSYQDPFSEIEMDVLVTDESGTSWRVPAFWAGEDVWKIRFSAPHTGRYSYESICTNQDDPGLHGQKGNLEIAEYNGKNPLYIHGPIGVMEDGQHFEYQDGTPFPWLGDTWWNLASSRMSEKGEVKLLAKDRVKKGFTLISIVDGFWCDLGPYDERMANEAGFAWTKDWGTINPAYYDILDKKIDIIAREGLMLAIAATWGFYIRFMGIEKMKQHVRYMLARYAAYPVVWLTAGETALPFYDYHNTDAYDSIVKEAARDWTEVLDYLKNLDPFHRLATAHVTYNRISTDDIEQAELLDFIMYQAGVHDGDQEMVSEQVKNLTERGLAIHPPRPVINAETCYEGMLYKCGPELQRWLFWHAALNGCAGWTYGANGIFTASHDEAPFGMPYYQTHWGEQTWQEAMHFEGAKQVGASRKYLNKYQWWKLQPVSGIVEEPEGKTEYEKTLTAEIPGELIMAYMQRNIILQDKTNYPYCIRFKNLKPGQKYSVHIYNPIRDYEQMLGDVETDQDGKLSTPVLPVMHDWVVIMYSK